MKSKNWSYLAGLFDGEGCAHIAEVKFNDFKEDGSQKIGFRVDIHITMTNLSVIKWLVANFGGVYYTKEAPRSNWNTAYRWVPKGKKNKEELLLGMLPYLIVKRDIANVCLEFLRLEGICPETRKLLCDKARLLTKRGKSVETNTVGSESSEKIESELIGNYESERTEMYVS